jgi:cell wall-associated NlpC family hydrolase
VTSPDPRRIPARPDLAAAHLRGEVAATRFEEPRAMTVAAPLAPLTLQPDAEMPLATQLLHGEGFAAYERDDAWTWGQSGADGYVGYIPSACLVDAGPAPTHRLAQTVTHVYPEPTKRARPIGWLTYGALVRAEAAEAGFAALETGGFVPMLHLAGIGTCAEDWVAEAQRLVGAPYLWGGRSPAGLDCSALVQLALQGAGQACPRDSDMQQGELGTTVPDEAALVRGDLVFWRGHVGIMLDGARLLHSNGHHMATVIEPLADAQARIAAAEKGAVLRIARLDEAPRRG